MEENGKLTMAEEVNVIGLQLIGNWLPLECVAIDAVGKYRYMLKDPQNTITFPLIVDVMLVLIK